MTVYTGTAGADTLIGSTGADELYGLAGNDSLSGANGADTLEGGLGSDTIDGGAGTDTVVYSNATSGVAVSLTSSGGAGSGTAGEASGDVLSTIEKIQGSAYNDTLGAVASSQALIGGAGDDVYIVGGSGVVVTEAVGEGVDEVRTSVATWTLAANVENLTYTGSATFTGTGNALANVITGGAGANYLRGGDGADTLVGVGSANYASYLDATAAVTVNLGAGTGSGFAAGDVFTNIQNLQGSGYSDNLVGDANANVILGESGHDTLSGGLGADTLTGGAGTDVADYSNATSGVAVSLTSSGGAGSGTAGEASGDVLSTIEKIQGSAYNDTLGAVASSQALIGGAGDDVYIVGGSGVVVTEAVGEGVDEVRTSVATWTLAANVENLTYTGSATFTGTGNALANVITGGAGANYLRGGDGADTLVGGGSANYASYLDATAAVTVNLGAGTGSGFAAGDVFTNIQNLQGSGYSDNLVGDANANIVLGEGGNDVLEGRGGADSLTGGAGTDIASYANAAGAISLNLSTGSHTGEAASDTFTTIEMYLGSAYADTLVGTSGADSLGGAAGADSIDGGLGRDVVVYLTSSAAVNVSFATSSASGGDAGGDTFTSIEGVIGSVYGDTLEGDGGDNVLHGGRGDDLITGGNGNDLIHGDTTTLTGLVLGGTVGPQADTIDGGAGNDTIDAAASDAGTEIHGSDGNDVIRLSFGTAYGDDGADTITVYNIGQAAAYGDDGNDTFNIQGLAAVEGGQDSDIYHFVYDGSGGYVSDFGTTGSDYIYFDSVATASDLTISTINTYDLLITHPNGSATTEVTIIGFYSNPLDYSIERIYAADGSYYDFDFI